MTRSRELSCLMLLCALSGALAACGNAAPTSDPPAAAKPAAGVASATSSNAKPAADAAGVKTAAEQGVSKLPSLQLQTVDGKPYDLASKRGHWVVVNFWATWCAPCLREMPDLDAFDASREDVETIGLAYEEISPEEMRAFLAKHPVRYPIAVVDTYDPPADFDTPRGLPTTYLIAPDGRIAKTFMGPLSSADLAAVIDGAAQKTPGAAHAGGLD